MATSVDVLTRRRSIAGLVLTIVAAIAAAIFSFGFLSGLPVLLAVVLVSRARRYKGAGVRARAWLALMVAVTGAALGYWLWQHMLWRSHYHPGGGGPVPPPTTLELAIMPLIAAGIGLVAFVLGVLARRYLPRITQSGP